MDLQNKFLFDGIMKSFSLGIGKKCGVLFHAKFGLLSDA